MRIFTHLLTKPPSHPGSEDVLLVVEVADQSAAYDREVKVPLYARSGVPEVWLVDLAGERVEVYREPGPGGYAQKLSLARGEVLSPEAFSDLRLAVADLLG